MQECTVFVPKMNQFLKYHFGDGTNSDSLCEGCDDYVYYSVFNLDFEEVDGGQFDFNTEEKAYDNDLMKALYDILTFAFGVTAEFIVLGVS